MTTAKSPRSRGILHLFLSIAVVVFSLGAFVLAGAAFDVWDFKITFVVAGVACAALYVWRRRIHFAASAILFLLAFVLSHLFPASSSSVVSAGAWAATLGLAVLFWPVMELLSWFETG